MRSFSSRLSRCCQIILPLLVVALAVSGCKAQRAKRAVERGNRFFQEEQFSRAELEFKNALQYNKQEPTAIARLGEILYAQGRHLSALRVLKEAVEVAPNNIDARSKLGWCYFYLGSPSDAFIHARAVLDKQPNHSEALILLSQTTTNISDGLQLLINLPDEAKTNAAVHVARGRLLSRMGNIPSADKEYAQALKIDTNFPWAHNALGDLLLAQKYPSNRVDEALSRIEDCYRKASEFSPFRSPLRLQFAQFLFRYRGDAKSLQLARQDVESVTSKVPDYLPAWLLLARIAVAQNDTNGYNLALEKALSMEPNDLEALVMRGDLLLANKDWTNAIAHFERVANNYPYHPGVRQKLALAYEGNQQPDAALAAVNEAVAANTNYFDAILLQARLNLANNAPDAAVRSLEPIVEKYPDYVLARRLLAEAYNLQHRANEAAGQYLALASQASNNPALLLSAAYNLAQLKRTNESASIFGAVAAGLSNNLGVVVYSATNLAYLSRNVEARGLFERGLQLQPTNFACLKGLVALEAAEGNLDSAIKLVQQDIELSPRPEVLMLLYDLHIEQAAQASGIRPNNRDNPVPAESLVTYKPAQPALKKAEAVLSRIIELDPHFAPAHLQLAKLQGAYSNNSKAIDSYKEVIRTTSVDREGKPLRDIDPLGRLVRFQALNNLACIYLQQSNQFAQALELAQEARALNANSPEVADTLGWALYKNGRFSEALPPLQESAAKLPAEPEVQFHLGMTYYMLGDEEPARLALQRAAQKGVPSGAQTLEAALAVLATDPAKPDPNAVAMLKQRVAEVPNDTIALARLAALQERTGDAQGALQSYQSALERKPADGRLLAGLARLHADKLNDLPRGLELARKARSSTPNDPLVAYTLGRLLYQTNEHRQAVTLLDESLGSTLLSRDPDVLWQVAWARYAVGQINPAEQAMRRAVSLPGDFSGKAEAERFLRLIEALKTPDKAQALMPEATAVLRTNSTYAPALMVDALVKAQNGNFKEAAAQYEQLLRSKPFFTPAMSRLALLLHEHLGQDAKALELATKVREANPNDAEMTKLLGMLAYKQGEYPRTVLFLSQYPGQTDAEVFCYLALAQFKLQRTNDSQEALTKATRLGVPPELKNDIAQLQNNLRAN